MSGAVLKAQRDSGQFFMVLHQRHSIWIVTSRSLSSMESTMESTSSVAGDLRAAGVRAFCG